MAFNRLDRNLLVRVGQHLKDAALLEEQSYGKPSGWGSTPEARESKARFDRLQRDVRDLEALRKRMEIAHPDMKVLVPVVLKAGAGHGD